MGPCSLTFSGLPLIPANGTQPASLIHPQQSDPLYGPCVAQHQPLFLCPRIILQLACIAERGVEILQHILAVVETEVGFVV